MSPAATDHSAKYFSERAIPLLKEYCEKFTALRDEARKVKDTIRDEMSRGYPKDATGLLELMARIRSLKPAALSLARHVSQRLEHGDLDEMDKLELALRLAEFEHALL